MTTDELERELAMVKRELADMSRRVERDLHEIRIRVQENGKRVTASMAAIEGIVGPLPDTPALDLSTRPLR